MVWVRDPDFGGIKIPKRVQERTRQRILKYAEEHYPGKYIRLEIRSALSFAILMLSQNRM